MSARHSLTVTGTLRCSCGYAWPLSREPLRDVQELAGAHEHAPKTQDAAAALADRHDQDEEDGR